MARRSAAGTFVSPTVGPIVEAVYSLGTVKAEHVWHLKAGIALGVTQLHVREGSAVLAGQRLLTTDSSTFSAPFQGTVTKVAVQKGEILMPGVPALQVTDLTDRYILLSLDQPSVLRVRPGHKAEISVESIRGRKLIGVVETIYPSNSQFLVRVRVDKMPAEILPDMTADVAIEVERREKALLIPLSAVRRGRVTIKRDGKRLKDVQVKVGAVNNDYAEVLDRSVLPGDEVWVPSG